MTVRALLLAAVLTGLAVLAGCGTASSPSPPAGVDELTIPTPSPDPDDFVPEVDNPWFPLEPGDTWVYAVSDAGGSHRMTVTVAPGPEIAGVATTSRVSTEPSRVVTDWFAQDEDGNVWWFGREGSWRAGDAGAEAGIAMLARPRIGDGYRMAYAAGVTEDTARVTSLDGDTVVAAGSYDGLLRLEQRSALDPGATAELAYARGVGLVEASEVSGSYRTVRLVSGPVASPTPAA
ncbi:hypothetical protein [Nocardioides sp. T2.26MG-1]|uniref:hypothetical protein n=1 Tax=Nocardioides sp. T2.26MG-1 TaxID=3041166 RepID=UPI00254258BE|nr:hypothetical protein [Nocardioides sp. T2.26MG-1]